MTMKQNTCILLLFGLMMQAHAFPYVQGAPYRPSFDSYAEYMRGEYDVILKPVKGFTDEDNYYSSLIFSDRPSIRLEDAFAPAALAGDSFGPIWSSSDKHCTICYCDEVHKLPDEELHMAPGYRAYCPTDLINKELQGNVADGTGNTPEMRGGLISVQSARQVGLSDKDSIYIYCFPQPERMSFLPAQDEEMPNLPHDACIGLLISGQNAEYMRFKILLSDKGFRQKDKYIKKILKSIRFEE